MTAVLEFAPEDERAYARARDRLIADFVAAQDPATAEDDGWAVHQVLHYKWTSIDGHLTQWTPGDLAEVLLELFPRKVVLEPADVALVLPSVERFIRYLDTAGLLAPGSAPLPRLVETLDVIGREFADAMADTAKWGMAKSLVSGMTAAGVDVRDRGAVDRYIDEFNAQPYEERGVALGSLPPVGPPALPPFVLAPRGRLDDAAARAPLFAQLRQFTAWVGKGRRLTQKGNLTLADGKELVELLATGDVVDERIGERVFHTRSSAELPTVDLLFRLARAAGFVKVRLGKVQQTKRGAAIGSCYADWEAAFRGVTKLGLVRHHYDGSYFGVPFWAPVLDEGLPGMLIQLHTAGGEIDIDELAASAWEVVDATFVLDDLADTQLQFQQDTVEHAVGLVLARLEELGAVDVRGVEEAATASGVPRPYGRRAALTELGSAGLHALIQDLGIPAPVAGEHRAADAETFLATAATLPRDVLAAEATAWVAERGPGDAVAQVAAALGRAATDSDQTLLLHAGSAFCVFDAAVDEALPVVTSLADDTRLRALAAIWCTGHDRRLPQMTPALSLVARGLTGRVEEVLEELTRAGAREAEATLGAARREAGPLAVALLDLVAKRHPDKAVAKAARKELFKVRTAMG